MIRRLAKKIVKRALGKSDTPESTHETHQPQSRSPEPEVKDNTDKNKDSPDLSNIECGAQELRERLEAGEPVVIVDVRERYELENHGMIETAIHIPLRELPTRWKELKSANEIVCYCAAGARSYNAAMFLREKGLFNATSMDGGISTWRAIGAATVKPPKDQ